MNDWINLALKTAEKAGEIIISYYKSNYEIQNKSYHNPVTTADYHANDYIKKTLQSAYPNFGWFSEETEDSSDRLEKEFVWIVDPLDGTKEFIEGVPNFVVSIALVKESLPVFGVLYNPVTKELFRAQVGEGAFLNDKQIFCSNNINISDMTILNSRSETRRGLWQPYENTFKQLLPIGSVAYKLGLTASSFADIFASLRPKNEWDICAGHCIIAEAGGILVDLDGNPVYYNQKNSLITPGLIAGNPNAVEKTLNLLNRK